MARLPLLIPFVIGAADGEPVAGKFDGPGSSVWTLDLPGSVVVDELPSSVWLLDDASTPPYIVPIPRFYPQLSGAGELTVAVAVRIGVQLSGAGTLSAVAIAVQSFTVSLSGAGTLAASRIARMTRTVGLSGSGTLSASRALRATRTAALSGSGTLSATVTAKASTVAQLSGAGTLSALFENIGGSIPAALGGSGTLSAVVAIRSVRTADLSGAGTLSAARTLRTLATAGLSGAGTLSGAVVLRRFVSADLSGSGVLAAAALKRDVRAVQLSGAGTLSAVAIAQVTRTGDFSGAGTLTADAVVRTYASQRMVKSGAFSLGSNFAYVDVTGWVADAAYPATEVINNLGLKLKAGFPVTISAVQLRNGTNGGSRLQIITESGAVLATKTSASPITIDPFVYTPAVDEVIRTQGYTSSGIGGNPTIPDNASTYLFVNVS